MPVPHFPPWEQQDPAGHLDPLPRLEVAPQNPSVETARAEESTDTESQID